MNPTLPGSLLFEEANMSICLVVARMGFVNTYPDQFIPAKNAVNVVGMTQQQAGWPGIKPGQAIANHSTGRRKETGLG